MAKRLGVKGMKGRGPPPEFRGLPPHVIAAHMEKKAEPQWREATFAEALEHAASRQVDATEGKYGGDHPANHYSGMLAVFTDGSKVYVESQWVYYSAETGGSTEPPEFWIKP